jgi:hypothetical protein
MTCATLFLSLCLVAQAEPAGDSNSALAKFTAAAKEYDIRLKDRGSTKLVLLEQPLLKWTNPARTNEDGAVFLWLNNGRPEVIGSLFTYKLNAVRTKHEFHSLATVPLTARYQTREAWLPPTGGVKFVAIPGAPVPADSSRLRTIQQKNLAREFTATLFNKDQEPTELRLLPQPLYKYEPTAGDVQEGSIFSFALGTDPEALLLIESRKVAGGWEWQYAFARFHFEGIVAKHNGTEVFNVPRDGDQLNTNLGDRDSRDKIYVTYHVE